MEHDLPWQDEYDFSVSNLITEARIHAGLTQEKLAKKAGVARSTIVRAELGNNIPGHPLLKKLAAAIGTRLLPPRFEFMKDEDTPADPGHGFSFVDPMTFSRLIFPSESISGTPAYTILNDAGTFSLEGISNFNYDLNKK
ncbi:MAG TPA: helix-turn-helix transcriptional regulator [Candidatus Paceibacterota bacterium]|nr:helix-turn-helix transcriptional regulator [Candidatus Paceibacterota bacterium]